MCHTPKNQTIILSDFRNSKIRREMLVRAECRLNILTFYLEAKPVLRVRLCPEKLQSHACQKPLIEGEIERMAAPVPIAIRNSSGKTILETSKNNRFELQLLESEAPQTKTTLFESPILRERTRPFSLNDIPRSGRFGTSRNGARFHTALDIPTPPEESVLAPAPGQVVYISHLKTQTSVFIKHTAPSSTSYFTALAHLKDISVSVGQWVTSQSTVGRAMNKTELASTHHLYNHVHLEVRRSIQDLGNASILTRKQSALEKIFIDPSRPLSGDWSW